MKVNYSNCTFYENKWVKSIRLQSIVFIFLWVMYNHMYVFSIFFNHIEDFLWIFYITNFGFYICHNVLFLMYTIWILLPLLIVCCLHNGFLFLKCGWPGSSAKYSTLTKEEDECLWMQFFKKIANLGQQGCSDLNIKQIKPSFNRFEEMLRRCGSAFTKLYYPMLLVKDGEQRSHFVWWSLSLYSTYKNVHFGLCQNLCWKAENLQTDTTQLLLVH